MCFLHLNSVCVAILYVIIHKSRHSPIKWITTCDYIETMVRVPKQTKVRDVIIALNQFGRNRFMRYIGSTRVRHKRMTSIAQQDRYCRPSSFSDMDKSPTI